MSHVPVLFAARIVGHVMWWVFVVSALFAGGITWWMEYNALDASFVGGGLDGWTIYTPTTGAGYVDIVGPPAPPWWQDPSVYALVAFVTVAIVAVVDACAVRRLIPGIVTVAAPFVALALFVLATPGGIEGVVPDSAISLMLVLVGVAIREVWMRVGAPRVGAQRME